MTRLPALLRSIAADIRGGVTTIGALSLTSVVGMSGLAMEVGHGYAQKVSNQRIADAAALAAGLAYSAGSDASLILPTAQAIARANGLPATAVAAPAPTTDAQGRTLISVTVTAPVSLYLSRVLTSRSAYDVQATGVAAVTAGGSSSSTTSSAPGCIIALSTSATKGILMQGGVTLSAPDCSVNSNRQISVENGPTLNAKTIVTGQTLVRVGGTTVTGEIKENQANAAVDPFANNTALKTQLDKVGNYVAPATILNPITPSSSTNWDFTWDGNAAVQSFKVTGGEFRVPAGTYNVGYVKIGGGVKVTFADNVNLSIASGYTGAGTVTLGATGSWKVNGGFDTGWGTFSPGNVGFHIGAGNNYLRGSNVVFGSGPFTLNGTLKVDGGVQLTFGAGAHNFGRIEMEGKQLTLGNGDLNVPGGIWVKGGSFMTAGDGNIVIGNTAGLAIEIGRNNSGGGGLTLGSGSFSANGHIVTQGDSQLVIGAATNHYVNGNMDLKGPATFGTGAWTVNGYFKNSSGGKMTGTDVTFYLAGVFDLAGGAMLDLRAPAASSGETLADMLIATRSTSATSFGAGAQSVLRGVLYAPNSPMTMTGGATINGGGGCFQLIASTVSLTGGPAATSSCAGSSSTTTVTTQSPPTVVLIR